MLNIEGEIGDNVLARVHNLNVEWRAREIMQEYRCTSLQRIAAVATILCVFATHHFYSNPGTYPGTYQGQSLALGDAPNPTYVPLIIFKLPRTGSSWFSQELNRWSFVTMPYLDLSVWSQLSSCYWEMPGNTCEERSVTFTRNICILIVDLQKCYPFSPIL